jgi:hypothetical protein
MDQQNITLLFALFMFLLCGLTSGAFTIDSTTLRINLHEQHAQQAHFTDVSSVPSESDTNLRMDGMELLLARYLSYAMTVEN